MKSVASLGKHFSVPRQHYLSSISRSFGEKSFLTEKLISYAQRFSYHWQNLCLILEETVESIGTQFTRPPPIREEEVVTRCSVLKKFANKNPTTSGFQKLAQNFLENCWGTIQLKNLIAKFFKNGGLLARLRYWVGQRRIAQNSFWMWRLHKWGPSMGLPDLLENRSSKHYSSDELWILEKRKSSQPK